MAPTKLTKADLKKTAKVLRAHKGDRMKAAAELGLTRTGFESRLIRLKVELPDEPLPPRRKGGNPTLSADLIQEAQEALVRHGGDKAAAARSLGLHRNTFSQRLDTAERRSDWKPVGRTKALAPVVMALPKGHAIARYILTCAQSGTKLHEPTWDALNALAGHYGARLLVSTFSYSHRQEGSAKRGTAGGDIGTEWYDPRIEPFACDDMVALAPSLVFNGHMNILPTAVDPLSGMMNYNGRASSIFPHAKVAMQSVPTMAGSAAKLQYTTGTCTQLNYIQKKAGQKAEFDHVFGGLIAEVNSKGEWWVRQLTVDRAGRVFDLDVVADANGVSEAPQSAAIVFGDLHTAHLDEDDMETRWGQAGLVNTLKPKLQVAHDILDMESRSHHNRRDPHKMFDLHVRGREDVRAEVRGVEALLRLMGRLGKVVVVNSNHDRHLERWLKEADWRTDPVNAEFYVDCQKAFLAAVRERKPFDALKWAVGPIKGVKFLAPGESLVVCHDRSGGVELGLHGDLGPSGARGSIRNLSRIGRRVVIGHSHAAGIFNGAFQTGVTPAPDKFDYARGAPSAWSHTDCLVYANGKRTLLTWWKGKWRA